MSVCDFVSGLVAGIVNLTVGHPFDTVKVNQQKNNTSLIPVIKSIHRLHGARGFFRGLEFPLVASGITNAVFFGTYEAAINEFTTGPDLYRTIGDLKVVGHRNKTYTDTFFAGCLAGVTQTIVGCPVEVVKIKLQAAEGGRQFSGPFDVTKYLVKTMGIFELYRGMGSMLLRDIPASGVYMATYTYFTDMVTKTNRENGIKDPSFWQLFMAGGMAGTLSWWTVIPIDVIKSKLQTDDPQNPMYKGVRDCARKIMKTQGIPGFFTGFIALTVRAFPVNGATFLAYEWFSRFCRIICKDPAGGCTRFTKFGSDYGDNNDNQFRGDS